MSNLSGLPPAALARAASIAMTQDIAVRLINLPDNLQNNAQPLQISGVVRGQTPDGQVQIETDRGIINILLKDRGNLPVGQKIELDIPAGRPPAPGAIRPQATAPVIETPHLQIPTGSSAATIAAASSVKLDRTQTIRSDELAEALSSLKSGEDIRLAAPLEVGQILRLVPISSLPQAAISPANIEILKPEQLFTLLLQTIQQTTDLPQEIKQNLIQILGRIDITTLLPNAGEGQAIAPEQLVNAALQKLGQSIDLPQNLKLQNAALPNIQLPNFSSSRPVDVQILAFQNGSFEATLTTARTGAQTPVIQTLPPGNFTVLPQSALQGPTSIQAPLPGNPVTSITGQLALPVEGETPVPVSQTPVQPQTANTAPASPALLGQVVSFTPSGQPVVSLALPGTSQPQNYAIQFVTNNIAEGTPIIVSPLQPDTKNSARPGLVPFAIGDAQSLPEWIKAETWDTVQSLITNVAHFSPGLAQTMIQMLPSAPQPQNMGALGLLFLAMMRTGNIEDWAGAPASNLLRQTGKIDILRALAGDTAMVNKLETAPLPNEWRGTIFPFWHDNQVHKLPLFYKQWKDDGENDMRAERNKKLRFMFELKLSRMGPVQVDGFMHREKLDMILRTKSIIGPNMQEALRKTYFKAMERSNLSGEITFQFKPEQWVSVEMPPQTSA